MESIKFLKKSDVINVYVFKFVSNGQKRNDKK
ncbi:hypothetical protein B0P06_000043 [Clostridium saccharoperbutylacetonicum]|uniref:Uncharacterized protein n=1 Tax=Clostridium saccharoperbutylacetonicum N1-4(HMT) TaxID=931276 RepID=M1LSA9_9CLOT|nr:hypothetical protein Cspa_c20690 [Clostridium saccharoperbutylacetonicum N1-4(HMT)]NRT63431.1 hypothetical protein [Clostridium saccharoperbutylacetonicum]NSB26793.1 hypothetical protein [Clostridium saccharoperbutylacetonicum]NSB40272.1 hypothetical protein [Clostridium saccharoperbutylacetonicum]